MPRGASRADAVSRRAAARCMVNPLDELQSRLGYRFRDPELLRLALTHRSHGAHNNERLEFLGDAALNLIVAVLLFVDGEADEGHLSYWRAALVREATLAELAREAGLGRQLLLGEGERRSGGERRESILADALEALIGAVFLDGGLDAAGALARRLYGDRLRQLDLHASAKDPKTTLQELLQGRKLQLPAYRVLDTSGPPHAQQFAVLCEVAELGLHSRGQGASRRAAEQQAAQSMIALLREQAPQAARRARGGNHAS